jgi:hypothetical protein
MPSKSHVTVPLNFEKLKNFFPLKILEVPVTPETREVHRFIQVYTFPLKKNSQKG